MTVIPPRDWNELPEYFCPACYVQDAITVSDGEAESNGDGENDVIVL